MGGAGGGLYGSHQAYHKSPPIIRTVRINPDGFGRKGKTVAKRWQRQKYITPFLSKTNSTSWGNFGSVWEIFGTA